MDAAATVKVGPFSRGGTSRVEVKAADHDFRPLPHVAFTRSTLPWEQGADPRHLPEEHLPHFSPLGWEHIVLTGEYRWEPDPRRQPGERRRPVGQ